MKNFKYTLFIALMLGFSASTFAQDPPPPPNNGNGAPSGNTPVGGGAPIGSGIVILITLAAGYGAKKVYSSTKRELAE